MYQKCTFTHGNAAWLDFTDFHPLEVVDRDSETQLQVGENLNIGRHTCTF